MKPQRLGILLASVIGSMVCGGSLYASPYLSLYQMNQAVEHNDLQRFSSHIDFPALRTSIKANLRTILAQETSHQSNPIMEMLGTVMNGFVLDPVVDSVVTPSGIAALLQGQQLQLGEKGAKAQFSPKENAVEVTAKYESLNQFAVSIQPKGEVESAVTLLLSRDGLDWKISGVRLPQSSALVKGLLPQNAMPKSDDIGHSAAKFLGRIL